MEAAEPVFDHDHPIETNACGVMVHDEWHGVTKHGELCWLRWNIDRLQESIRVEGL